MSQSHIPTHTPFSTFTSKDSKAFESAAITERALLEDLFNNWEKSDEDTNHRKAKIIETFTKYESYPIRELFSSAHAYEPVIDNISSHENYLYAANFFLTQKGLVPPTKSDRKRLFQIQFGYFFNDDSWFSNKAKSSAHYFESLYESDESLANNLYWDELLENCPNLLKNFSIGFLIRLALHKQHLAKIIVKEFSTLTPDQKKQIQNKYPTDLDIYYTLYGRQFPKEDQADFIKKFFTIDNISTIYQLAKYNANFQELLKDVIKNDALNSETIKSLFAGANKIFDPQRQLHARRYCAAFILGFTPPALLANIDHVEVAAFMADAKIEEDPWLENLYSNYLSFSDNKKSLIDKIESITKNMASSTLPSIKEAAAVSQDDLGDGVGSAAEPIPSHHSAPPINLEPNQNKIIKTLSCSSIRKEIGITINENIKQWRTDGFNCPVEVQKSATRLNAESDLYNRNKNNFFFTKSENTFAQERIKNILIDDSSNKLQDNISEANIWLVDRLLENLTIDWHAIVPQEFSEIFSFSGKEKYQQRMEQRLFANANPYLKWVLMRHEILRLPQGLAKGTTPKNLRLAQLALLDEYNKPIKDAINNCLEIGFQVSDNDQPAALKWPGPCYFYNKTTQILHFSEDGKNYSPLEFKQDRALSFRDAFSSRINSSSPQTLITSTEKNQIHTALKIPPPPYLQKNSFLLDEIQNSALANEIDDLTEKYLGKFNFDSRRLAELENFANSTTPIDPSTIASLQEDISRLGEQLSAGTWLKLLNKQAGEIFIVDGIPASKIREVFLLASDQQIAARADIFTAYLISLDESHNIIDAVLAEKILHLNDDYLKPWVFEISETLTKAINASDSISANIWQKLIPLHEIEDFIPLQKFEPIFLSCSNIFIATHLEFFAALFNGTPLSDNVAKRIVAIPNGETNYHSHGKTNFIQPLSTFTDRYPNTVIAAIDSQKNNIPVVEWEKLLALRTSGDSSFLIAHNMVPADKWVTFFKDFNESSIRSRMIDFVTLFSRDDFNFNFTVQTTSKDVLTKELCSLLEEGENHRPLNVVFKNACTSTQMLAQKFLMALSNPQIAALSQNDIQDLIVAANFSGEQTWEFYNKGDAAKNLLKAALIQRKQIDDFRNALAFINFNGDTKDILDRLGFLHKANPELYERAAREYPASASADKAGLLALVAPAVTQESSAEVTSTAKLSDLELQKNIALFNPFFVEISLDSFFKENETIHSAVLTRLFDAHFENYKPDFVKPNFDSSAFLASDRNPEKLIQRRSVRDHVLVKQTRLPELREQLPTTVSNSPLDPKKTPAAENNLPLDPKKTIATLHEKLETTININQHAFLTALLAIPEVRPSTSATLSADSSFATSYAGKSPLEIFQNLENNETQFISLLHQSPNLGKEWTFDQIKEFLTVDDITTQSFVAFVQLSNVKSSHYFKIIFDKEALPVFLLLLGQKIQMHESAADASITEEKLKHKAVCTLRHSLPKNFPLVEQYLKQFKIPATKTPHSTPKKKDPLLAATVLNPENTPSDTPEKKIMSGVFAQLLKNNDKGNDTAFQIAPGKIASTDKGQFVLDKSSSPSATKSGPQSESDSLVDSLANKIAARRSATKEDNKSENDDEWSSSEDENIQPLVNLKNPSKAPAAASTSSAPIPPVKNSVSDTAAASSSNHQVGNLNKTEPWLEKQTGPQTSPADVSLPKPKAIETPAAAKASNPPLVAPTPTIGTKTTPSHIAFSPAGHHSASTAPTADKSSVAPVAAASNHKPKGAADLKPQSPATAAPPEASNHKPKRAADLKPQSPATAAPPVANVPKTNDPTPPTVKAGTPPSLTAGSISTPGNTAKTPVPLPPPVPPPAPTLSPPPPPAAAPPAKQGKTQTPPPPSGTSASMDSGLMAQIEAGKQLKKTVTIDKSAPLLSKPKSTDNIPKPGTTGLQPSTNVTNSATLPQSGSQPEIGSVNMASARANLGSGKEQKKSSLNVLLDGIGEIKFEEIQGKAGKFKSSPTDSLKNTIQIFVTDKKNKALTRDSREEKLRSLLAITPALAGLIDSAKLTTIQSLVDTYFKSLESKSSPLAGNGSSLFGKSATSSSSSSQRGTSTPQHSQTPSPG